MDSLSATISGSIFGSSGCSSADSSSTVVAVVSSAFSSSLIWSTMGEGYERHTEEVDEATYLWLVETGENASTDAMMVKTMPAAVVRGAMVMML